MAFNLKQARAVSFQARVCDFRVCTYCKGSLCYGRDTLNLANLAVFFSVSYVFYQLIAKLSLLVVILL